MKCGENVCRSFQTPPNVVPRRKLRRRLIISQASRVTTDTAHWKVMQSRTSLIGSPPQILKGNFELPCVLWRITEVVMRKFTEKHCKHCSNFKTYHVQFKQAVLKPLFVWCHKKRHIYIYHIPTIYVKKWLHEQMPQVNLQKYKKMQDKVNQYER